MQKIKRYGSIAAFSVLCLFAGWLGGRSQFTSASSHKKIAAFPFPSDSVGNVTPPKPFWVFDDTVWHDDLEIILQNAVGNIRVMRWYRPEKTFSDYRTNEIYHGTPAKRLNFSTCSGGAMYKTMTKAGYRNGVQFAGHYAFASWGCGCPCQGCNIIDVITGNVFEGPMASGGYEFRTDSRLLIVNPPDSSGLYEAYFPHPEQYLWTGSAFKRLE